MKAYGTVVPLVGIRRPYTNVLCSRRRDRNIESTTVGEDARRRGWPKFARRDDRHDLENSMLDCMPKRVCVENKVDRTHVLHDSSAANEDGSMC
jgi:hypothetical protein